MKASRHRLPQDAEATLRFCPVRCQALKLWMLWTTSLVAGCVPKQVERAIKPLAVQTQVVALVSRPNTASLIGEFRARVETDLSFRVGGRVARRNVDVGDRVAAGDVLATIDSLQQIADVNAAKAAIQSANATLQQTSANAKRIESLLDSQSASQAEFEDAKAAMLTAEGSVNISKSMLTTAESNLSYSTLKADQSGVIVARLVEVGQVVSAAQAVFKLAVEGEREVVFEAFQTHVNERPSEDKIELALVSDPSVTTQGIIREISPTIDPSNGTVRVKVTVPNPPEKMSLGAPVIGVAQFAPSNVVELPWSALSRKGAQTAVWVVNPTSHRVAERIVTVERFAAGMLLVSSGLSTGEKVVINGVQLIRPDQEIRAIEGTRP